MLGLAPGAAGAEPAPTDPLPSWNEGAPKQAIVDFVARVTKEDTPDYVPPAERIATFDNDGTLWCEQPIYPQAAFVHDRIKELAASHPEWKQTQPYRAILENDRATVAKFAEHEIADLVGATHSGMTPEEFVGTARV